MCSIPGGFEWIVIFFMAMAVYILPLAFGVFVVVFLIKINNTLSAIQKKLEQK